MESTSTLGKPTHYSRRSWGPVLTGETLHPGNGVSQAEIGLRAGYTNGPVTTESVQPLAAPTSA